MRIWFGGLLVGLFSTTAMGQSPAAGQDTLAFLEDYRLETSLIKREQDCQRILRKLVESLQRVRRAHTNAEGFNFQSRDDQTSHVWMPKAVDLAWDLQVELRQQLAKLHQENKLNPQTILYAREAIGSLRFLREWFSLITIYDVKEKQAEYKEGVGFFTSHFKSGEVFNLLSLRPGDVILTREASPMRAAAMGRMPIDGSESHFSHTILVGLSPKGTLVGIESLMETGVRIFDLFEILKRRSSRAALYRHRNASLATKAAKVMYARAVQGQIPYNFSGDLRCRDQLMCTQVVREAYHMAGEDPHSLPTYPSGLGQGAQRSSLGEGFGVLEDADNFFAPSDFDLEFGFDLVGEWMDPEGD